MSFFGLEIGRKAVITQQAALNVTGHNIANANTPGFTRQEAVLVATPPVNDLTTGIGQMGSGVTIEQIRRLRDNFADAQYRKENTTAGYWASKQEALDKVELIINEPSDSGLRSVMDQFWVSLQKLSESPESRAARSTVIQSAIALAETFHHMDKQYQELQEDLNQSVEVQVREVNSLATQIADLNQQILNIKVSGQEPNDLYDQRDYLIDQLTRLVDVQIRVEQSGLVNIYLGGRVLVHDVQAYGVIAKRDESDPRGFYNMVWAVDEQPVDLRGGSIKGLIEARGTWDGTKHTGMVPDLRQKLDALAEAITKKMNEVHEQGYGLDTSTGGVYEHVKLFKEPADFPGDTFVSWASFIDLNPAVRDNLDKLAAATQVETLPDGNVRGQPGDGSNALALAALKHAVTTMGNASFDDYWRSAVAQIGVDAQEARRMCKNQEVLLQQLDNKRQQTAGVSIDEEMTNMIRFQHAYGAAARLITAVDEMLEILISRLGVVGR